MKNLHIAARIIILIFAVGGILKAVGVFASHPAGPSAHICFTADLDSNGVTCLNDESVVHALDLPDAHVSILTGDGSGPAYDTLRIVIQIKNTTGSYFDAGVSDVDLGSDYGTNNAMEVRLQDVVNSAGVTLVRGRAYRLTAENLSRSDAEQNPTDSFSPYSIAKVAPLGSVDFTYQS
jgi:hypothetical protein